MLVLPTATVVDVERWKLLEGVAQTPDAGRAVHSVDFKLCLLVAHAVFILIWIDLRRRVVRMQWRLLPGLPSKSLRNAGLCVHERRGRRMGVEDYTLRE